VSEPGAYEALIAKEALVAVPNNEPVAYIKPVSIE